jgi:SPP1 family predicted phage head-tail adaptor
MLRGINLGQMDVLITIVRVTTTKNSVTNEPEEAYTDLDTVYAKRLGPVSKEQYEANQLVAVGTSRFMIRRRDDINETMIVVDGTNSYRISGIEDFGRQGYQILTVVKRDNA